MQTFWQEVKHKNTLISSVDETENLPLISLKSIYLYKELKYCLRIEAQLWQNTKHKNAAKIINFNHSAGWWEES